MKGKKLYFGQITKLHGLTLHKELPFWWIDLKFGTTVDYDPLFNFESKIDVGNVLLHVEIVRQGLTNF